MKRTSFLNPTIYLVTMLDLIIIKVLLTDPGFGPGNMAYLHVLSYGTITYLKITTVIWYLSVYI